MGDGFYSSKDPTNSIRVLKEEATKVKKNQKNQTTQNTAIQYQTHIQSPSLQ